MQLGQWLPTRLDDFLQRYGRLVGLAAGILLTGFELRAHRLFQQQLWAPGASLAFLETAGVIAAIAILVFLCASRSARIAFVIGLFVAAMVGFGVGAAGVVIFMVLSSLALGDLIGGTRLRQAWDPLTGAIVATASGYAAYVLILGVFAAYRVNFAAIYAIALTLPLVANPAGLTRHLSIFRRWLTARTPFDFWTGAFAAMLAFLLFAQIVYASLPERYADALALHLVIPTTMDAIGRWHFDVRTHVMAVAPMAADLGYAIAYLLGGESATKLLNFTILLLISGFVFAVSRRASSTRFALGLTCLFVSLPVAFIETATLFIDNTLTVFLVGAIVVAFHVLRKGRYSGRLAVIASLLCAAALATKLPAVFLAGPIGLAVVVLAALRVRGRFLPVLLAIIVLIAGVGLWPYLHAYILTGNPVFPLSNAIFKSPFYPPVNFVATSYPPSLSPATLFHMMFDSHKYIEGSDGVIGFQFLVFAFAVASCILARPKTSTSIYIAIGLFFIFIISANTQYIRYIYPVFPLLLIGLTSIYSPPDKGDRLKTYSNRSLYLAMFCCAALNVVFLPSAGWILSNFDIRATALTSEKQAVLRRDTPIRLLIPIINDLAGTKARVGFLSAPYAAGLQGTPLVADWYNMDFLGPISSVHTTADASRLLHRFKLTHLIIADSMAGMSQSMSPYPEAAEALRTAALAEGREISKVRGASLIALNDSVYFQSLLTDDPAHGLDLWQKLDGAKPATSDGHDGINLTAGAQIWRPTTIPALGYTLYQFTATVTCSDHPAVLGLQVNWQDAVGRLVSAEGVNETCATPGPMTIKHQFEAPPAAAGVTLYINETGAAEILLKNVMFSVGPTGSEGLKAGTLATAAAQ
jgi:hypothetical protein